MNFQELTSYNWGAMIPEYILIATIAILMVADLLMEEKKSRHRFGYIAIAGIIFSIMALVAILSGESISILNNSFYLDGLSKSFKFILLFGGLFTLLLSIDQKSEDGIESARAEYYYLFLFALLGTMFLASSNDLITLFVSLELLSISAYIMVGIKKHSLKSTEAALKYVINGGISTSISIFGFSYLYGLTGTTKLHEMANYLSTPQSKEVQLMLAVAFLLILVGITFKISAVPFQMWAPDVYEGASTPVTAFLSVVSKSAGFILLIRIFYTVFVYAKTGYENNGTLFDLYQIYIAVIACITMIVGNLAALRKKNIKRILAYSSISHAGYILAAFSSKNAIFSFDALWFYLVAYLLMMFGIMAVVHHLSTVEKSDQITIFTGLYSRSPWLAISTSIFLLSLAGIPGTAGFIGKMNIFMVLLNGEKGHFVVAAILLLATVLSYVYYFGIMVQMFFRQPHIVEKKKVKVNTLLIIAICLIGTILLGLYPSIATDFFHSILY